MEPSIVGPLSQAARVFLISSVLWCLQSPGALGVPEHPIVRESGLDKWAKQGEVPTVSQNLSPVLPPAKVVRANLTVCLKGGGTPLDQPHMVDQEDCGQQQGGHMNGPEKYGHLGPGQVHPRHKDKEWEDKLEHSRQRHILKLSPDIEGVEVCAVENPEPKPGEEEDEESVVEVADAIAGKHAVVLSL